MKPEEILNDDFLKQFENGAALTLFFRTT